MKTKCNIYRQKLVKAEKDNRQLIGLLMVYHSFNDEIEVPVNIRLEDMFVFEHPDLDFYANLRSIRAYWGDLEEHSLARPKLPLPRKVSRYKIGIKNIIIN